MEITLYATREDVVRKEVDCPIPWTVGRPDLVQELEYLKGLGSDAMVYSCGPATLVRACREIAHCNGNHFKMDTFMF